MASLRGPTIPFTNDPDWKSLDLQDIQARISRELKETSYSTFKF
jgi:hypothetical protein